MALSCTIFEVFDINIW